MLRRLAIPLALAAVACGTRLSSLEHKSDSAGGGSSDATAAGGTASFAFTASYQQAPVDVILIRDQATHGYPIDDRITEAAPVLAALLWNLHDVHVGVFDDVFQPPQPGAAPPAGGTPQPTTATPIVDPKVATPVLDPSSLSAIDFSNALAARIAAAGNRGGDYLPASVLMAIQAESQKAGGGLVAGLLRPGAFVAVILMGATLDPADPYDASDVLTAFQALGPNLMVSALTLDNGGCTVVDTTPPVVINPNHQPQRNLEMKLQKATLGRFASVCANITYSLFMTDVVTNGTGTNYFSVALPQPVDGSTIAITANGVPVPDFRYLAGSTNLDVSTIIANGENFTVTAAPAGAQPAVTTGTAPNVDNVPQVSGTPAAQ